MVTYLPHTRRVQGFMETEDAQINYKDEKAMKIKAATQSYSFLFSFPQTQNSLSCSVLGIEVARHQLNKHTF